MEDKTPADGSIEAFRAAYWESDELYTLCARFCGLSDTEYWVLLMIRDGADMQSTISDWLRVSRQTVNSACKLLVKKGLVRMETPEENLRVRRIRLTERGRALMQEKVERVFELEEATWLTMREEERVLLTQLTRKYNALMKSALLKTEEQSSEDAWPQP